MLCLFPQARLGTDRGTDASTRPERRERNVQRREDTRRRKRAQREQAIEERYDAETARVAAQMDAIIRRADEHGASN